MKELLNIANVAVVAIALFVTTGCHRAEKVNSKPAYWLDPIQQTNQVGDATPDGTNLVQMFISGRIERLGYGTDTGYVTIATIPIISGTNFIKFPAPLTKTNTVTLTNTVTVTNGPAAPANLRVLPEKP